MARFVCPSWACLGSGTGVLEILGRSCQQRGCHCGATPGTQSFVPNPVAQPARLGGARGESGVSHTYNFKLKKQCAVYWRCRVSPEREAHKDHITVQAIMQRVYYIYISKCFSKQQPPYEQSRITGSFGVTNDP